MQQTAIAWLSRLFGTLLLMTLLQPAASTAARYDPQMGPVQMYLYPHLHNLIWDPHVPGRVYATSPIGGWQSTDAGQSWTPLSDATPNLHYGRILHPPGSHELYLYRTDNPLLYYSNDLGAQWELVSDGLVRQLARMPDTSSGVYAVGSDGALRRSMDTGHTWEVRATPADAPVAALAADASGALYAIAGWGNDFTLHRSLDGAATWQALAPWPDQQAPREFSVAADGALLATLPSTDQPSVSARALWRSVDQGQHWHTAAVPAARIAVVTPEANGTLWVGSDDGRVWRNTDPATWSDPAGWRELPLQLAQPVNLRDDIPYTPAITDIAPGPNGVVLVGTIHGIYRATTPDGPALLRARGLLPTAALPTTAVTPGEDDLFFVETGQVLREPFRTAWEHYGGIAVLGMPRTQPFIERSLDTGQDELTVYFERGRLGMAIDGSETITLGRSAVPLMAESGIVPIPSAPQPDCAFFAATQSNVCGAIQHAWNKHGGVAMLGLPLGNASADGTQWFERTRIETSGAGTFFCLIGSEELQKRGWVP